MVHRTPKSSKIETNTMDSTPVCCSEFLNENALLVLVILKWNIRSSGLGLDGETALSWLDTCSVLANFITSSLAFLLFFVCSVTIFQHLQQANKTKHATFAVYCSGMHATSVVWDRESDDIEPRGSVEGNAGEAITIVNSCTRRRWFGAVSYMSHKFAPFALS